MTNGKIELTLLDLALIHLDDSARNISNGTYPREMTQIGLGEALARSRSHACLIMKGGVKRGLIVMSTEHVRGFRQKVLVASLTESGRTEARRLSKYLSSAGVSLEDMMAPPKKLGTDIRALTEKIHLLQIQIDDLKARVDALTSEANLNGIGMGALI